MFASASPSLSSLNIVASKSAIDFFHFLFYETKWYFARVVIRLVSYMKWKLWMEFRTCINGCNEGTTLKSCQSALRFLVRNLYATWIAFMGISNRMSPPPCCTYLYNQYPRHRKFDNLHFRDLMLRRRDSDYTHLLERTFNILLQVPHNIKNLPQNMMNSSVSLRNPVGFLKSVFHNISMFEND